jgi:hypothetical protein
MTEPASHDHAPASRDHGPGQQRSTGDRDAWSAATDPIGQQSGADGPADEQSAGGQSAEGQSAEGQQTGQRPAGQAPGRQSGGGQSADRKPASRKPADRKPADRAPVLDRDARRTTSGATGRVVSRPSQPRKPDSRRSSPPGGDLLTDLQRWLIRSSAKTMRREIEGQVRRTLGGGRKEPEDIWGTATTEPPPDLSEPPECAWCPICRAARRMRESGPGLSSQVSGASNVVAAAVQDAIVAFDTVLSRTAAASGQEPPADRSPASGPADSASDEAERAQDEPGDRG